MKEFFIIPLSVSLLEVGDLIFIPPSSKGIYEELIPGFYLVIGRPYNNAVKLDRRLFSYDIDVNKPLLWSGCAYERNGKFQMIQAKS
jgi:hypothetical protein